MDTEVKSPPALNLIVEKYIALRDRKSEMKKAYEGQVAEVDAAMERCEAYLLNTMNGMGIDSIKTAAGTAYTKVATSATVADWPLVLGFIQKHELWPMLEKRVSKTVVESYREEHNDLPPGINWTETRVLNIRRT